MRDIRRLGNWFIDFKSAQAIRWIDAMQFELYDSRLSDSAFKVDFSLLPISFREFLKAEYPKNFKL